MRPKLVALIAAGALTTGWLLASIVSPPVARLQGLPPRVEQPAAAREGQQPEAQYTEQLRLKLRAAPAAPVTRRNPFVFGTSPAPVPRKVANERSKHVSANEPPPAPVVTGPLLRLSGIGATATENGTVRTAVISDGVTVHLVKIGETVGGYAVVAISDDAVTVENAAGAQWLLRLR
jgi:hypothetical protein